MSRWFATLCLVPLVAVTAIRAEDKPAAPVRSIERKDPKFDALIAPDAKVEELAGGFKWSEGPVWDKKHAQVLFCDIPNNMIYKCLKKKDSKSF